MTNPLHALKDIHTPAAISSWPPAPGWILLTIITLVVIIIFLYYLKKRFHYYQAKSQALKILETINPVNHSAQKKSPAQAYTNHAQAYNALLKRVAQHYFPNESNIATLSEKRWVEFLVSKLPEKYKKLANIQANNLVTSLYRPIKTETELRQFIRLWIKECL
ncbi:DUF4381 domain-containing protein [Piscirickettsia litoralis]|uniref:DUF4381 domain-containing protein n=1 Tax=Piscirickettsia litoralis TaxID=1891921 RepID=A0ABX3A080_9GAMM|nr:DUF4381 domain-containing protein [Piscirickettsia litoralis]ODN42267.1 hypothetical protein BGC07_04110 [Piscirickettsia litoralis]